MDLGVVSTGKVDDEVVRADRLRCGNHLFFGCVRAREQDVVANGAGEQEGVLRDNTQLGAE